MEKVSGNHIFFLSSSIFTIRSLYPGPLVCVSLRVKDRRGLRMSRKSMYESDVKITF